MADDEPKGVMGMESFLRFVFPREFFNSLMNRFFLCGYPGEKKGKYNSQHEAGEEKIDFHIAWLCER